MELKTNLPTSPKNSLKKGLNLQNLISRSIFGTLMLISYFYIVSKNDFFPLIIPLVLTVGITYEIISVTKRVDKPFSISPFLICFISSVIFSMKVIPSLAFFNPKIDLFLSLVHLKPVLFTLYAIGLISSVTCLRRRTLKNQLLLLMVVHASTYLSSLTCSTYILNIKYGKFFYVYPSLLVIGNDIFAYFVGKFFGKTPLTALSPKKTVEGFFGGFLLTFLLGLLLTFLKIQGLFFPDSLHNHLELPSKFFNIKIIYLHNISFVLAASFLAPLGGFIASAVKRTFQKKDFGALIPGHGGLTDRFDCQILMTFFIYYYMGVFFNQRSSAAISISNFLKENLKEDDLQELYKLLNK
jgi:phosphatidate cytidylyltransferase